MSSALIFNTFTETFDANKTIPKNYYKEFLNIKEGFFNSNFVQSKRRNSMD